MTIFYTITRKSIDNKQDEVFNLALEMKILAISKDNPGIINDDFKPHLKGEAANVFGFYQNNTIRKIYFEKDGDAANMILECEDAEEAKNILEKLPLVRAGLISFTIIPLIPYTGFARLFEQP